MRIGIIGAGSWGTALAQHLSSSFAENSLGTEVALWGRDQGVLSDIQQNQVNSKYLPGISLSKNLKIVSSLAELVNTADVYVLSVPTSATREVCLEIKDLLQKNRRNSPVGASGSEELPYFISTAKGLEAGSNQRLSQIISEVFEGEAHIAALSGPSFALEVAKGMPTALVLSGVECARKEGIWADVVGAFHVGMMRVYTSDDLIGVELGGVLKNVISVASGVGDGLGLGLNARAGLLTRGLKELSNLIKAEGGRSSTVMGLSGLGDLLLTSTGDLSRNRRFGMLLGQGLSIEDAKVEIGQTIEAIIACTCAYELAKGHNLDCPIIEQVTLVIRGETTPSQALKDLLMREQKAE